MTFGILLMVATANDLTVTPVGSYSSLAVAEAEKKLLAERMAVQTAPASGGTTSVEGAPLWWFTVCVRKT